ncbi:MAG: hypothetical protein O2960_29160 [Verrucomicrobia bacterium]|nr:hypothetical protein [Verrucomicrobiota bacterium]
MAKRAATRTTKPRNGNGHSDGHGNSRPTLAVETNDKGQIKSHIRQKWLAETPEERVRQTYVVTLHNEYGIDLDQMHVAGAWIGTKYADEIAAETTRLETTIEAAKEAKDADARKAVQKELREYLKRMEDTKTREARSLLKERFDYPIFLYEAEKVGISATGEPDANELYPNDRVSTDMKPEETCLELSRRFRKTPNAFTLTGNQA